jgi:tripartite-type tricarboxylate transporter receptor subunit TctC
MLMALFQKETGTRFTLVPYRGFPPEMQDLVAGRIDFFFDTPVQLPFTRAGNVKAYAVTSDARLTQAPDILTLRFTNGSSSILSATSRRSLPS